MYLLLQCLYVFHRNLSRLRLPLYPLSQCSYMFYRDKYRTKIASVPAFTVLLSHMNTVKAGTEAISVLHLS